VKVLPGETIPKLEGESNYKPWHTQICLHLGRRGLWRVTNGEKLQPDQEESSKVAQWYAKAEKASYIILLSLAEGPLEHVDHLPVTEPKAILSTLEQLYGHLVLKHLLFNPCSARKASYNVCQLMTMFQTFSCTYLQELRELLRSPVPPFKSGQADKI
jgi:hypothetical protein